MIDWFGFKERRETMRRTLALAATAALFFSFAAACENPLRPSEVGERNHSESGSTEPGESGTQYGLTDTARESRSGVDLVMQYEAGQQRFTGTVTNTTSAAVSNVRVEIHLSNGVELGPTPRVTLAAGQVHEVELDARGQSFTRWSVHVELGSGGS